MFFMLFCCSGRLLFCSLTFFQKVDGPKLMITPTKDWHLAMGPVPPELNSYTADVLDALEEAKFPISEKSQPTATDTKDYIVKRYSATAISLLPDLPDC